MPALNNALVPFVSLRTPDMAEEDVRELVREYASWVADELWHRAGCNDSSLYAYDNDARGKVRSFLVDVLGIVAERTECLTCVLEPMHVDDVFRDLYREAYAREFYDTARFCMRLNLFADELDERSFLAAPSACSAWDAVSSAHQDERWEAYKADCESRYIAQPHCMNKELLQDAFIGSIVVAPIKEGVIGRTLIDPSWLLDRGVFIRLSDYELTVRGKRLRVAAFPFRKQDGEVLSCAEVSTLDLACYYSNEYSQYSYTMPHTLLAEVSRLSSERVTPTSGLNYEAVGRLLRSLGFDPIKYNRDKLGTFYSSPYDREPSSRVDWFNRALRAYISSGMPVAVNAQPYEDRDDVDGGLRHVRCTGLPGHSLVCLGLAAYGPLDDDQLVERAEGEYLSALVEDGRAKSLSLVGVEELERGREYVVSDDSLLPYAIVSYPDISGFEGLEACEMLVPLAPDMALEANEAREYAEAIMRSEKLGLVRWSGDGLADGEQLVLTQQMVSVRSYVRFRVATSDTALAPLFELGMFPTYSWVFEVLRASEWRKPESDRKAVAEVVLDATAKGQGDPFSSAVLLRYPTMVHYHGPGSGSVTLAPRVGSYSEFPVFARNLRHVEPRDVAPYSDECLVGTGMVVCDETSPSYAPLSLYSMIGDAMACGGEGQSVVTEIPEDCRLTASDVEWTREMLSTQLARNTSALAYSETETCGVCAI